MCPINLCFCIDDNYVPQLGAVLYSLINSNKRSVDYDIYILNFELSHYSKEKLSSIFTNLKHYNLYFIQVEDQNLGALSAGGHISKATYLRFSITNSLAHIDKVIYLDADIIINDELSELWSLDLKDNYVGAVTNPFFNRYSMLKMEKSWGYFNAGVLVINLPKWREINVMDTAMLFLKENKKAAIMFDQDALNFVFKGEWLNLPIRWNLQTIFLRKRVFFKNQPQVIEAINRPGIIHYSTSSKPWQLFDAHPMRKKYLDCEKLFIKVKRDFGLANVFRAFFRRVYLTFVFLYQKTC